MKIEDLEKLITCLNDSMKELLKERDDKIAKLEGQVQELTRSYQEKLIKAKDTEIGYINCECGGKYNAAYHKRHITTQAHINFFKMKELTAQVEKFNSK